MISKIQQEKNWYRKCQLILEFHQGKCAQFSGKRKDKWKVADTARSLDLSVGYVSESLKLAQCENGFIRNLNRENALRILKGMKV